MILPIASFYLFLATATALPAASDNSRSAAQSLVVHEAPSSSRPYVLPKNYGRAVTIGQQVYRFSVTGNSSDNAFTLLQTNAPDSSELGVLPHIHEQHYENFYCTRGRINLWAKKNITGEQGRRLTQGDYGAVPRGTTHTFQIVDPDTQMTGVISPGGFEELFIFLADSEFTSSTGANFAPVESSTGGGSDPDIIASLEDFDVFAQLTYNPRQDFDVNGAAGGTGNWHNGTNSLAPNVETPNFIAKGYGPKYLNTDGGIYRIVAPFASNNQTESAFTEGTITISPLLSNQTATKTTLETALAFQVEEGSLRIQVPGYESIDIIQGDVLFLPRGTTFTYHATAAFTKALYVTGGGNSFDQDLLDRSIPWSYASYPTYAGYTI